MGSVEVEIDRAALLAEASEIGAQHSTAPAPGPSDVAGDPQPEALPQPAEPLALAEDVKPAVRMLVGELCDLIVPAWEIEQEESDGVADAAALVLAYWMPPGAVHPKYIALASLAGAIWGVARKRRTDDGKWFPMRRKTVERAASTAPAQQPKAPSLSL